MSTLALTLLDFQTQLPFSNKIEDRQLQPFVKTAFALDLVPLLGHATLEAVDALAPFTAIKYTAGLPIAAGSILSRRERLYRAATNAVLPIAPPPAVPTEAAAPWTYLPLHTLWLHYLKPWFVQQAFARFLSQHGLDITKAGITVPIDRNQGTYDRPSAAQKAELQASIDVTAEALKSRLTRFMREENLLYQSGGCGYDYSLDACGPAPRAVASHRRHSSRVRGV